MGGHLELVIEIGIQDLLVPQLAMAGIRGTYEQSHECTCVWDFRNGGPYTQECNASGSVLGPTLYMQTPYLHNYHRCICAIRGWDSLGDPSTNDVRHLHRGILNL